MKKIKLTQLTPDPRNANQGTERGRGMLERSLTELGAGRSIVVDRNGVTIGGAKTLEAAVESGFENGILVETDGTQLVVVKRTDLDLEADDRAKKLAIADNRVGEVSLSWSAEVLAEIADEVDLSGLFFEDELSKILNVEEVDLSNLEEEPEKLEREPVDGEKYPLAIVLSGRLLRRWKELKELKGIKNDTKLFLEVMGWEDE